MDHTSAENGKRALEFQQSISRPGVLNLPTSAELKATMSLGSMNSNLLLPVEATSDQKNYAQGFIDALNSIHNLHKFEFEAKKELLSPGFLAPLIGSTNGTVDLPSPFAQTPSNRDLQAILQAMVSTPTGVVTSTAGVLAAAAASLQSPFNILPGPSILSIPASTSSHRMDPIAEKSLQAEAMERVSPESDYGVEVKQENGNSEDTSDNNSERSRSSSVTRPSNSSGYMSKSQKAGFEMTMDEQEQRKLERKRARNRAAASKCRQKKMDRIQELEILVQNEKQRGQSLDTELQRMHNIMGQLQRLVERHNQKGCNTIPM